MGSWKVGVLGGRGAEAVGEFIGGDESEGEGIGGGGWGEGFAVSVVECHLGDFRAAPNEETTDGGEEDANDKEGW